MSCSTCQKKLRAWIRGELAGEEAVAVEKHVAECYFCAVVVERESAFLDALRSRHGVPEPSAGFRERVMAVATSRPTRKSSRVYGSPAIIGSVAAALVIGIALGLGLSPEAQDSPMQTTTTTSVQDHAASDLNLETVRLVFNTIEAMDNVTLTVQLPSHVEVSGYPGYQQLSWNVSLDQGENIVKLPLNVLFPGEGELVARLTDGEREKIFRTPLVQTSARSNSESAL